MANNQDPPSYGNQEAKEQGMTGAKGGGQAGGDAGSGQARQGTQHNEASRTAPDASTGFAPGKAPSEQGEGEPSPETIRRHQQGNFGGRGNASGSHSAHGEDTEATAQSGEPGESHTEGGRHGRQQLPGDRNPA